MFRKISMMFMLLLLLHLTLFAVDPIKFHFNDLEYGPAFGPLMFQDVHAYTDLNYTASTSSVCLSENLDFLNGVNGVTVFIDNGYLDSFFNINTVNPNGNPFALGQSGDRRIYAEAVGDIKVNGVPVLKANNIFIIMDVCYPQPFGTGDEEFGEGWGTIIPDESDPDWVNYFDQNGTGQIHFKFSSFSSVVQGYYGIYDCDVVVEPSQFRRELAAEHIIYLNQDYTFNNTGITMNFINLEDFHHELYSSDRFTVQKIEALPLGVLPDGINRITHNYWEIGTSANTYQATVSFDLTTIDGISTPENLRVLYRSNPLADWQIIASVLNGNNLTLINHTSEGQYTIGTIADDTLPVTLSSFNAVMDATNSVNVKWKTESESDMLGYHILRANQENITNAVNLTINPILAVNTSDGKLYSFTDSEIINQTDYYYWLNSISMNGEVTYYGPVHILTKFSNDDNPPVISKEGFRSIYPNPVGNNDVCYAEYKLNESDQAKFTIYNIKGQHVASTEVININLNSVRLPISKLTAGIYFVSLETSKGKDIKKLLILK